MSKEQGLSQYIIHNVYSLEKLTYNEDTNRIIYRFRMTHGKNKRNFQIFKMTYTSKTDPVVKLELWYNWIKKGGKTLLKMI